MSENTVLEVLDYNDEDAKRITARDPLPLVPEGTFRVLIENEKHLTDLSTLEKTLNCPQMQLQAVVLANPDDASSKTNMRLFNRIQFPLATAPGIKIDKQAMSICASQFHRLAPDQVPARPQYINKTPVVNGSAVTEEEAEELKVAQNRASLDFATRLWRGQTSLKGRMYYVDVTHKASNGRTFANMNNIREELGEGETVTEL